MSNTVDLVKAAQSREYMAFEDQALAALKGKLQANPVMKEKLAKLNVAQGLSESEDEMDDEMKDKKSKMKSKMKDMMGEEDEKEEDETDAEEKEEEGDEKEGDEDEKDEDDE